MKLDITNKIQRLQTRQGVVRVIVPFSPLLVLFIVTPVDIKQSIPSPYAEVFCSGNKLEIPFDPRVMIRLGLSSAGKFNDKP